MQIVNVPKFISYRECLPLGSLRYLWEDNIKLNKIILFDVTQRRLVVSHRGLETTYRFYLQRSSLTTYISTLCYLPERRRYNLHRGRSLKSRNKLDIQETECGCMEWMHLVWDKDRRRTLQCGDIRLVFRKTLD